MNCYAKLASQTSVDQEIVIPDSVPRIFIDLDYYGDINLHEDSLGLQIKKIFRNPTEEEFSSGSYNEGMPPRLVLLDRSDSMFKVILIEGMIKEKMYGGWIKKTDYLNIYYKGMYAPDIINLILYQHPDHTSKVLLKYENHIDDKCIVIDFCGNWLKVKIKIDGKYYIGWLSPDQQCAEVLTTCN